MVRAMVAKGETIMHIFCGGMPRSGSTLQFQLAASIVEAADAGRRLPWVSPGDLHSFLLPKADGIDVCKSHVPVKTIINRINDGRATALYVHRDLRDVIVSTMFHQKVGFNELMTSATISDAVGWGKTWEALPGVLIQRYDDLIGDMRQGVDEICEHINIDLPEETKEQIVTAHSIKRQQSRISDISIELGWDVTELLHRNHIGPGEGESLWRSILVDFQVKQIEDRYGGWLVEHGYGMANK